MYVGIAQTYSWDEVVAGGGDKGGNKETGGGGGAHTHSPTPPPQRRLAKSFSVAPSTVSKGTYLLSFVSFLYYHYIFLFIMHFAYIVMIT